MTSVCKQGAGQCTICTQASKEYILNEQGRAPFVHKARKEDYILDAGHGKDDDGDASPVLQAHAWCVPLLSALAPFPCSELLCCCSSVLAAPSLYSAAPPSAPVLHTVCSSPAPPSSSCCSVPTPPSSYRCSSGTDLAKSPIDQPSQL